MWLIVTTGLSQARTCDGWRSAMTTVRLATMPMSGRKICPHMHAMKDADNHSTSERETSLKVRCYAKFSRRRTKR